MWSKLKAQKERLLEPSQRPSAVEEVADTVCGCCKDLTYQERLLGWSICFSLGFILSFGSTMRLFQLLKGNPAPFATMYSIGNLLSIASTSFFVGPVKQVQNMWTTKRRTSAFLYIFFIFLTLLLCFLPEVPLRMEAVVLSISCQCCALVWYSLSYIPYGRKILSSCLRKTCGCNADEEI